MVPNALELTTAIGAGHVEAGGTRYEVDHGTAGMFVLLNQTKAQSVPAQITLPSVHLLLRNPSAPDDAARALSVNLSGFLNTSDLMQPKGIEARLSATIPHVSFEDLTYYWPSLAAKGGKNG